MIIILNRNIKKNKKSKFVTLNLRKNLKKVHVGGEYSAKKVIDICLVIALVLVSIYTFSIAMTKEFHGDAIFVSSTKKKLPIYSVDTEKKQVAISFDAAWGDVRLLEIT